MTQQSSLTYYSDELAPTLSAVEGPVEVFVLTPERDQALKAQAVAMGTIPRGAFAYMEVFDQSPRSLERQKARRAAKMGGEVLRLLMESDDASGDSDPKNRAIRMAATMHVTQEVNHAVIVEAARKLRNESSEGELALATARLYGGEIDRAQSQLYPELDEAVSNHILAQLAETLGRVETTSLPDDQQTFLADFRQTYPFALEPRQVEALPVLEQQRVVEFKEELRRRYRPALLRVYEALGGISVAQLPEAVNLFLREIGMPMARDLDDHAGWLCVKDESFVGFKTNPSKKRILCGRFSQITWERFEELMLHEGVAHARRSENGAASGVEALRTGLTGNASLEEGLGLLFEQLYRGRLTQNLGRDDFRYITIAYVDGKIDGEKHDETEALRFVSSCMLANEIAQGSSSSVAKTLAAKRGLGYDHVKRAFRGMPPGKTHHANLSYKQGKIDAMRLIANSNASAAELIDYVMQAKFNPLNAEHKEVLALLGLRAEI